MGYPERALQISLAANTSYNTVGEENNNLILGPTLAVSKQFFDKQLRTNFSSSYNTSFANGEQQNNILNFRLGGNYAWLQKHNFSLNFLALFRNSELNTGRNLTITFGYSYAFDNFKLNIRPGNRAPTTKEGPRENTLSFRYRNVSYSGTIPELNRQLTDVFQSSQFADIPQFKKNNLTLLLASVKDQKKETIYKENALDFLKELYAYADFLDTYNEVLFGVIKKIKRDMRKIDMELENSFVDTKVKVDKHPLHQKEGTVDGSEEQWTKYKELVAEQEERLQKLVGHRWMESTFEQFTTIDVVEDPVGHLREFKKAVAGRSFELFDQTRDVEQLGDYLENGIIDFYYKKSLGFVNPDNFELRYINKN